MHTHSVLRRWIVALAIAASWGGVKSAAAAVFNPLPATADGAPDSLRDAITQANTNAESDTINLAAGNYDLTVVSATQDNANAGGDLDIAADGGSTLIIVGQGLSSTTIRMLGVASDRILHLLEGANVVLQDLTIFNGQARDDGTAGAPPDQTDAEGGLVLMFDASLTAERVQFLGGTLVGGFFGASALDARGGAIAVENALLTLRNSELRTNTVQGGSTPVDSGENGGSAFGGGIYCADASILLENSTVVSNIANGNSGGNGADFDPSLPGGDGGDGLGGGIYAAGCNVIVRLSALWDNTASGGNGGIGGDGVDGADGGAAGAAAGGAIYIPSTDEPLQLIDSTISGNLALGGNGGAGGAGTQLGGGDGGSNEGGEGGGLSMVGDLVLLNSTIADNDAQAGTVGSGGGGTPPGSPGGAEVAASGGMNVVGNVSGESTISADNSSADSFGGGSLDNSLFELAPSGIALGTNQFGVDPALQALGNNGGPTATHAILLGSPAHDQGSNSTGLLTDQRGPGFARTIGAGTDVGAFEVQGGQGGPVEVPTLGEWGQLVLACALALAAWAVLRR